MSEQDDGQLAEDLMPLEEPTVAQELFSSETTLVMPDEDQLPSPGSASGQRVGRDEMNLAEFPFALLADRVPQGLNTIRFEDTVEGKEGELVRRTWTVTGSDEFGLPVAADEQVYVALMEVTKEQGFNHRTISITRYDLLKRLGWPDKGASYRRLREALDRLLGVTIKAERAFWDNAKQRYVDVGFHIIDDYALYDEAPGRKRPRERGSRSDRSGGASTAHGTIQQGLPLSFVTWNQVIFRSFQAGNIKQLDTAFYFGLRSSLARRLYRYLDKKRYDGKVAFRIGLKKLAFEKLGMSRSYYPSHIKQELQRAHTELLAQGFLRQIEYETSGDGQGEELVVYYFPSRQYLTGAAENSQAQRAQQQPTDAQQLIEELTQQGVTLSVARQLVQQHPQEVRLQLQYLPYRAPQDPAAVLVEAIRGRWEPPASYLKARASKEQRSQPRQQEQQGPLAVENPTAATRAAPAVRTERPDQAALALAAQKAVYEALDAHQQAHIRQRAMARLQQENPFVASRPQSRAYEAMLQEEIGAILRAEHGTELAAALAQLQQEDRPPEIA